MADKESILKREAGHFDSELSRRSHVDEDAINRFPQMECNT